MLVALVATAMFTSCGNEPENGVNVTVSQLIGSWCIPADDAGNAVDWYWELTDKGILNYYEPTDYVYGEEDYDYEKGEWYESVPTQHSKAVYKDGYVYNGPETEWTKQMSGQYVFDEEEQVLYFSGFRVGTLKRISKDQIEFHDESDWLQDGVCYRIKGFK